MRRTPGVSREVKCPLLNRVSPVSGTQCVGQRSSRPLFLGPARTTVTKLLTPLPLLPITPRSLVVSVDDLQGLLPTESSLPPQTPQLSHGLRVEEDVEGLSARRPSLTHLLVLISLGQKRSRRRTPVIIARGVRGGGCVRVYVTRRPRSGVTWAPVSKVPDRTVQGRVWTDLSTVRLEVLNDSLRGPRSRGSHD